MTDSFERYSRLLKLSGVFLSIVVIAVAAIYTVVAIAPTNGALGHLERYLVVLIFVPSPVLLVGWLLRRRFGPARPFGLIAFLVAQCIVILALYYGLNGFGVI